MPPARFAPSDAAGKRGHLLFISEGTLYGAALRFRDSPCHWRDLPCRRTRHPILGICERNIGLLIGDCRSERAAGWPDWSGKEVGSRLVRREPVHRQFPIVSRDERSIVFNRPGPASSDIWGCSIFAQGVPSRITFDPSVDNLPIWSHDGRRILWPSNRRGGFDLYVKPGKRGTGVYGTPHPHSGLRVTGWATDWSRYGKWVLFQRPGDKASQDLWIASQSPTSSGQQKPVPYLNSQFAQSERGVLTGWAMDRVCIKRVRPRRKVHVQAFPLTDEKDQISIGGGSDPEWRKDGAELFYLAADRNLMAVPVRVTGNAFATRCSESTVSSPRRPGSSSLCTPPSDGRFLIARPLDAGTTAPMTVVLNWLARVKR